MRTIESSVTSADATSSTVTVCTGPLDDATVVHSSVSSPMLTSSTSNSAVPPILQTTTVPRVGSTGEVTSSDGRVKLSGAVGASAHAAPNTTIMPTADQRKGEDLIRALS